MNRLLTNMPSSPKCSDDVHQGGVGGSGAASSAAADANQGGVGGCATRYGGAPGGYHQARRRTPTRVGPGLAACRMSGMQNAGQLNVPEVNRISRRSL
jgi:hypothetical protein